MRSAQLFTVTAAIAVLSLACDESRVGNPNPSGNSPPAQKDASVSASSDTGLPPGVDAGFAPPADAGSAAADTGHSNPNVDAGHTNPPHDAGHTTPPTGVPVLGNGTHSMSNVTLAIIADTDVGHRTPTDLAFNPNVPNQAWVTNKGDNSMWIANDIGTPQENAVWRQEQRSGRHFLAKPSSLAMGDNDAFATSQDEDQITQASTPADFMGPTLWTTDLQVFDGGHAGHLDMLHNSPSGKGIAWESGNIYWYFDGAHSSITRYDFHQDHGPGGTDHRDGEIARFAEGQVRGDSMAPSHMDIDQTAGLLYIADTGNNRIGTLNIRSGSRGRSIGPNYDGCVMYGMSGATVNTLVDGSAHGLVKPAGLELHNNLIFISDFATSKIYAFDKSGNLVDWLDTEMPPNSLMGFDFDPQGQLYFVDASGNRILRLTAK